MVACPQTGDHIDVLVENLSDELFTDELCLCLKQYGVPGSAMGSFVHSMSKLCNQEEYKVGGSRRIERINLEMKAGYDLLSVFSE